MTEGFLLFNYHGEEYQTLYKVVGNPDSRTRTPLVVAHGGPGQSCLVLAKMPVSLIFTLQVSLMTTFFLSLTSPPSSPSQLSSDQIGNSRSTHLPSKPPSFWSIDLFIDELVNLLGHFHIQDSFDFLSHSWGGILGPEELSKAFPEDVQKGLAVGVADMEAYGKALRMFHKKHGCLVDPWPEELVYSMNQSISPSADISVAVGMFMGELRPWSIVDRLQ
ncbi:hypothetical protein EDD85DRAFT_962704 [Armillaria nabsnona]|nr:hypothetical protein EDD85DRAFT_962704 [Armillaria nabsnona]